MNDDMRRAELEDILFEFVCEVERPDWPTIRAWMDRFPTYAHEIGDFAAAWILAETLPENPETAAIPAERWHEFGRRAYERAVAETQAKYMPTPLTSLSDAAKAEGLTPGELAKRVGLSRALLGGIDQRIIVGVPERMVDRLAATLRRSRDAVAAYLKLPPTLAASNAYKAEKPPTLKQTMTFDEAVRADSNLSPDEKSALLRLES